MCGIDWVSDHHDVTLIDLGGRKLGRWISDDAAGLGELTGMLAEHHGGPSVDRAAHGAARLALRHLTYAGLVEQDQRGAWTHCCPAVAG